MSLKCTKEKDQIQCKPSTKANPPNVFLAKTLTLRGIAYPNIRLK